MALFSRKPQPQPADDATVRRIARLVNEGRTAEADVLTDATDNPRDTALRAFRYIDLA